MKNGTPVFYLSDLSSCSGRSYNMGICTWGNPYQMQWLQKGALTQQIIFSQFFSRMKELNEEDTIYVAQLGSGQRELGLAKVSLLFFVIGIVVLWNPCWRKGPFGVIASVKPFLQTQIRTSYLSALSFYPKNFTFFNLDFWKNPLWHVQQKRLK